MIWDPLDPAEPQEPRELPLPFRDRGERLDPRDPWEPPLPFRDLGERLDRQDRWAHRVPRAFPDRQQRGDPLDPLDPLDRQEPQEDQEPQDRQDRRDRLVLRRIRLERKIRLSSVFARDSLGITHSVSRMLRLLPSHGH